MRPWSLMAPSVWGVLSAVPILTKLHSYPLFGGLISRSGQQADWFLERLAYGELLTARAMARCGSPEGYMVLINYLDDVRASLAEHAHEELISHHWAGLWQERVRLGQLARAGQRRPAARSLPRHN